MLSVKGENKMDFPTEADMASRTSTDALERFEEMVAQYRQGRETLGVVDMYELAAINLGATGAQVQDVWNKHLNTRGQLGGAP